MKQAVILPPIFFKCFYSNNYLFSGFVGRIRLLEREIQIIEQNLVDENGR